MRRGRMLMLLAVVVIILLVGVVALPSLLGGGEEIPPEQLTAEASVRTVVLLLEPLERGDRITINKIKLVQVSLGDVMFLNESIQYHLDISEVLGSYAVKDILLSEDEQTFLKVGDLTDDTLSLIGEQFSDHASLIPAGFVAFPIPTNRFASVAYGIARGDHVNVIATLIFVDIDPQFQTILPNSAATILNPGFSFLYDNGDAIQFGSSELISTWLPQVVTGGSVSPQGRADIDPVLGEFFYYVPSEPQRPRIVSQTVLYNTTILNVGNFTLVDEQGREIAIVTPKPTLTAAQETGEESVPTPKPPGTEPPDVVTLVVRPQEAVTLNFLVYSGAQLTMALRSRGDEVVEPTLPVTLGFLMTNYNIPSPEKLLIGLNPSVDVLLPPLLPTLTPQVFR